MIQHQHIALLYHHFWPQNSDKISSAYVSAYA
jgi:hypothetical protein